MDQSEAFLAGRRAALDSLAPSLNKFEPGQEHDDWQRGWCQGAQETSDYANRKVARAKWETESDRYIGGGVWR